MNNPRGSNNKLSEQSNNAQNQNRLFDSQNNAAAGYQIGDACKPVCLDGNNYDATKEGAMQGTMTYFQESELYIEWHMQHGCGVSGSNLRCQVILQYMTEADNPSLRDGTKRGNQNTAGGEQEPPTAADAADVTLGQHEPLDFYLSCKSRERNNGLYIADQNVNDNRGATATRQNPGGNGNNDRNGLECPEERDYYPYWHPSPWHDIIIFTEDTDRCAFYREESQNVKAKGECSLAEFNNAAACSAEGGVWREEPAFGEPPPDCIGGLSSRDNHNGNVRNGHAMYHVWKIPEYVSGRTVLRIRYNITTKDFDANSAVRAEASGSEKDPTDQFFIDSTFDSIITNDPNKDFLELGEGRELQVQLNTNQAARTFQDRSHTFIVKERPADVAPNARIVNYNVRGRRGNIVQVYPSVEYDFVPEDLTIEKGAYLHFQWTGSDANNRNNAGNGRAGTDRSNLVQVASRGENVPLPISKQTLFFDAASDPANPEGQKLVDRFAYLDQDTVLQTIDEACDPDENNDNALSNCKQLNGASAYFDGGLVQMTQAGVHHIASTRNNDFSNRSQKATIRVGSPTWEWYAVAGVALGGIVAAATAIYVCLAVYALKHPTSLLFSRRYRPRVLRWLVSKDTLERRLEERRSGLSEERQKQQANMIKNRDIEAAADSPAQPAQQKQTCGGLCLRRAHRSGFGEHRLVVVAYGALNVVVFLVGAATNLTGGFMGSYAYPLAKGAGFTLDLNFAIVVLPTLKVLQTAVRHSSATREWMPIDDPIYFHIVVACFIGLGTLVHVGSHAVHMASIALAPPLQRDPLELFALSADEQVSGTPLLEQLFLNYRLRFAPLTGVLITVIMAAMYVTALPCVRRGTNACTRRLGGYNVFWRVHASWKLLFLLLLVHAPIRLWIWLFFPAILLVLDRKVLASSTSMYAKLKTAKLMPRDVIGLTFQAPRGFAYQAGQYILLGWRGEWHPFTLTSAPEERFLSVHIRASDSLDWCSALRRRLIEGAPADAAGTPEAERRKAVPGTEIEYTGAVVNHMVYCQPSGPSKARNSSAAAAKGLERASSQDTWDSRTLEQNLPKDAVVLQLAGPFGAPAQKVWQFEVVMVVGAGIGVTPFASIMRSVQLRTLQRQALAKSGPAPSPSKWWGSMAGNSSTAPASVDVTSKLLEDVITVPKKVYFYWIIRSQEEADWFYDLLAAAADGPAKDIIEICVFMTGEVELSRVKKLPCSKGQFFGRPQWGRIFKEKGEEHRGKHVGVFLCGSPQIGAELDRQSKNHTDVTGGSGGTRFSFFPEHF